VLTEADRAGLLARGADAVFGPYASEDGMLAEIGAIVDRVRSGAMAEVRDVAGEPGPLAGRVVAVTGAARGLGRAYTGELCRQGAAGADLGQAGRDPVRVLHPSDGETVIGLGRPHPAPPGHTSKVPPKQ
jgi:hypothetical protein